MRYYIVRVHSSRALRALQIILDGFCSEHW